MFTRAVSRLGRKRPPSEAISIRDKEQRGAQKWAVSLDSLLEDPRGVSEFTSFLKKEFSEENVLFWLACEDFKKIHEKDQMQKKARKIYTTFLSSKATAQVNVDGQSRISEEMLQDPHPLMFLMLQEQIYNLMKYDSYQRFLKSDAFLVLSRSEDDERPAVGAGESAPKRASRIYNT